jgi:hypothetical protein
MRLLQGLVALNKLHKILVAKKKTWHQDFIMVIK